MPRLTKDGQALALDATVAECGANALLRLEVFQIFVATPSWYAETESESTAHGVEHSMHFSPMRIASRFWTRRILKVIRFLWDDESQLFNLPYAYEYEERELLRSECNRFLQLCSGIICGSSGARGR